MYICDLPPHQNQFVKAVLCSPVSHRLINQDTMAYASFFQLGIMAFGFSDFKCSQLLDGVFSVLIK
jgi:hypothetical protein